MVAAPSNPAVNQCAANFIMLVRTVSPRPLPPTAMFAMPFCYLTCVSHFARTKSSYTPLLSGGKLITILYFVSQIRLKNTLSSNKYASDRVKYVYNIISNVLRYYQRIQSRTRMAAKVVEVIRK